MIAEYSVRGFLNHRPLSRRAQTRGIAGMASNNGRTDQHQTESGMRRPKTRSPTEGKLFCLCQITRQYSIYDGVREHVFHRIDRMAVDAHLVLKVRSSGQTRLDE